MLDLFAMTECKLIALVDAVLPQYWQQNNRIKLKPNTIKHHKHQFNLFQWFFVMHSKMRMHTIQYEKNRMKCDTVLYIGLLCNRNVSIYLFLKLPPFSVGNGIFFYWFNDIHFCDIIRSIIHHSRIINGIHCLNTCTINIDSPIVIDGH